MKLLCNSVLFAGLDRSPMKDYVSNILSKYTKIY